MRLWWKARRIWIVGAALILLAGAFSMGADWIIPVIALVPGSLPEPVTKLFPLVPTTALTACLVSRGTGAERSACRRLGGYDSAFVAAATVAGVAICLFCVPTPYRELGMIGARNLLGFVGMALIVGTVGTWRLAGVVPAGLGMVALTMATRPLAFWAWPLMDSSSRTGWACALLLGAAGFLLLLLLPPQAAANGTEEEPTI